MSHLIRHRQLLAAAILFALATATQSAPAQERVVSTILIIRCGPTDIILNQPLLEALLMEPGATVCLKKEFGDDFKQINAVNALMPVSHNTGTFQVHMTCKAWITGTWNEERREKATKAFVSHVKQRLNDILYEAPLTDLSERRVRLRQSHLNISGQLLAVNAEINQANQRATTAASQFTELNKELLATKLAVATEEHVREHLDKAREQNVATRDGLRKSSQKTARGRNELSNELRELVTRRSVANDKSLDKKLTARINQLQSQLDEISAGLARWTELTADVQNMLTIILEQLPISELALQRARARLASLQDSMADLHARQQMIAQDAAKGPNHGIAAAHLQIDSQVTREQLLEVEAQLARIRPVRYEVLQTR